MPPPYDDWNKVTVFPYGNDLYGISISPDGKHISAGLSEIATTSRICIEIEETRIPIREASQATFVVIAPLIVPMLFISIMLEQPHGPISTFLSLFPLSAPVAMMTRLASGGVPVWHPILAVVLSLLTAALILRTVTGFFRTQTLLSGQEFKVSLFFKAMIGKI